MTNYLDSELKILSMFREGATFYLNGNEYKVIVSGKPRTSKGEPKTDIYVKSIDIFNKNYKELKISFKQHNADFLENKMSDTRAEQIFGSMWQSRISQFTQQLRCEFLKRPLIFKNKFGHTNPGSITIGWRFELLNKTGGMLSDKIDLNPQELLEIYSGNQLSSSKRNANVAGNVISNSGVANYIINSDINMIENVQDAIKHMEDINKFCLKNPDVYFACKALNYRTFNKKIEGNRHLSVYVVWDVKNNKLQPEIKFDNPLVTKGAHVRDKLVSSLSTLGISDTDSINDSNVSSLTYVK